MKIHGLDNCTLGCDIKWGKEQQEKSLDIGVNQQLLTTIRYSIHQTVFNEEQEQAFVSYLQESSQWHFGFTAFECRVLAYQCVVKFEIECPELCHINKSAGNDWMLSFRKQQSFPED